MNEKNVKLQSNNSFFALLLLKEREMGISGDSVREDWTFDSETPLSVFGIK